MDNISLELLAFLIVSGFLAAFIDSVVGGGGLISLPALLLTGLPPTMALGTNKMASVMGSLTSTLAFLRSGKIDVKLVKYLFPLSLFGSALGVYVVRQIPSNFLKPLLVVMLIAVLIYTLCRKSFGDTSTYQGMSRRKGTLSGILVVLLGFYDGFFGPGAGTFFLFGFLLLGFDFVVAAGNARALNFASNLAAVAAFGVSGLINYQYSIPMGLAMVAGAWTGSHLAINKGVGYVRPLFIVVTSVLIGKQLWDLLLGR
jgi:uncharacterized membrane protein YfcA